MSLMNFDTPLDVQRTSRLVIETEAVAVTETVTVEPVSIGTPVTSVGPIDPVTFLLKGDDEWGWRELRDYVRDQITRRFGPPPDQQAHVEKAIFDSFLKRWGGVPTEVDEKTVHVGGMGPAIARFAFEVLEGRWAGAPISVNRFCKNSDDFFAVPIATRIDAALQGR